MTGFGRAVTRKLVGAQDIVEYPTRLGNQCILLHELGLNAYVNTEEELLEALSETAQRPEMLQICLKSSRCRRFWDVFKSGRTPFSGRDPVRLVEYGGRYWAVEGKHRVCLAKRAGVETLEAEVYPLAADTESLLAPEGDPGRFLFSYHLSPGNAKSIRGTVGFLWVDCPANLDLKRFAFLRGVWLDAAQDTAGGAEELLPGLRYRVSVSKQTKRSFLSLRGEFTVQAEVMVEADHPKTKIWLVEAPAAGVFGPHLCRGGPSGFRTLYRYGCWRKRHFKQLSRALPCPFTTDGG